MIAFYQERSSPRLSCAIVGNVVIPGGHGSNAVSPAISNDGRWKDLATAIATRGTLPGVQLATAWEGYVGTRSFHPKDGDTTIAQGRALAAMVGTWQLKRLFQCMREGTDIAAQAGFRHIQLHAAHGYLFSLLVDARLYSKAADCLELIACWAAECRCLGLETSLRMSLRTGDDQFDREGSTGLQDQISALPIDFVDVSSGFYNIDKRLIYPSTAPVLAARRRETAALAVRHPKQAFILSGRANSAIAGFSTNVHLGLCRDLIANPHFLEEPARGCCNSGKCHYHSRGAQHVTCPRWLEQ
jgi:NADPH2 dehydrogenase